MVHWYSHIGEKLLRLTYDDLGIKLKGTLQVCDGCVMSKEKSRAVRKKTYTRSSKPGEIIFVGIIGPFMESLIENRYWISIVDDYIHYSSSFFTKTKLQLPNKTE